MGTPEGRTYQALNFTAAVPGRAIQVILGGPAGAAQWQVTWAVTGFTAVTIQLEGSQDGSSWFAFSGASVVIEGANPTNWTGATTNNTIVVQSMTPYVRVNVTGVTGVGTVQTTLLGFPAVAGASFGSGFSLVDESTFTAGATAGVPIMGEFGGQLLILATNASRQLQVAGSVTSVPPTAAHVSNNAPAAVTSSTQAIAANAARVKLILQNVGASALYILLGTGTASSTNFTFILPEGGSLLDGTSPIYTDTNWLGAVQWAAVNAAGGEGVANEETP